MLPEHGRVYRTCDIGLLDSTDHSLLISALDYVSQKGVTRMLPEVARPLTVREVEILHLLGLGKTTKEIAVVLEISAETIATHRKHICKKLAVHSTAELIAEAARFVKMS